jgi:protein disulfide-isomerase
MVEHLAEKYRKDSMGTEMMDSMTQNAKNSGLDFHFEKPLWPLFNAHRLLHLAKHDKSNELEELLFKAYLTDGKNINNLDTLSELGLKRTSTKMKLKLYIPMLMQKP